MARLSRAPRLPRGLCHPSLCSRTMAARVCTPSLWKEKLWFGAQNCFSSGLQYPWRRQHNKMCPWPSRAGFSLVHMREAPDGFGPCHHHDIFHHCGGVPTPFLAHTGGTQVPWQLLLWFSQGALTFQFFLAWKRPLEKTALRALHPFPPSIGWSLLIYPGRLDAPRRQWGPG